MGQLDPPLITSLRKKRIGSDVLPEEVVVISSPLKRAAETSHLFGCQDPIIDKRIAEMDLGNFQGKPTTIRNLKEINELDLRPDDRTHGGESYNNFMDRVINFYQEYKDEILDVVVFTHASVIRALFVQILGLKSRYWKPQFMEMISVDPNAEKLEINQKQVIITLT